MFKYSYLLAFSLFTLTAQDIVLAKTTCTFEDLKVVLKKDLAKKKFHIKISSINGRSVVDKAQIGIFSDFKYSKTLNLTVDLSHCEFGPKEYIVYCGTEHRKNKGIRLTVTDFFGKNIGAFGPMFYWRHLYDFSYVYSLNLMHTANHDAYENENSYSIKLVAEGNGDYRIPGEFLTEFDVSANELDKACVQN